MLDPTISAAGGEILPDLLAPDLKIVFCGTAAGASSARLGQYYAHPQNKFWKTLHEIGLTDSVLRPCEFQRLREQRIGLTDIAKYASGMDRNLPSGSLTRAACDALREKILSAQPAFIAFTSLKAGRTFLGSSAAFGEQQERIGATRIWVLPSPSPAANWNWKGAERWWFDLANAAKSLT